MQTNTARAVAARLAGDRGVSAEPMTGYTRLDHYATQTGTRSGRLTGPQARRYQKKACRNGEDSEVSK